jgi:nucleoside-diphosphate-sugar epimerase
MIRHLQTSPTQPSRVVVLGASGFVGKDLLGHLGTLGVKALGLSSRDLDLTRPDAVDRLGQTVASGDALVFVSALTPDKGKDVRTLMRNLSMGEHVAAFLERSACAHVVYISSDAVYDDAANPVRETSPCGPSGFHGLMHLTREKMLALAVQKSKVPYLILRPTLLYGAGDTHNGYGPNRFLRTARADRKITLFGNGEEKRDHVHIDDVSRLIGLCLTHRSEGVLNVATGTAHSFHEVAQAAAALCGHGVKIECLPRATPITHRHFDVTATVKAFPSFRYAPLAEGLAAAARAEVNRAAA